MAVANQLSDPGLGEEAAEQVARPVLRLLETDPEAVDPAKVAEILKTLAGPAVLAPEVIPVVVGVAVVVGLIVLAYYLYEKSKEQPEPPKPVQPCPPVQPNPPPQLAPAPQPGAARPPKAAGSWMDEPVKPADLSKQESDHWDQCKQKHDDYKKLQSEYGKRSAANKDIKRRLGTGQSVTPAEMQAFCDSLADLIDLAIKEIARRQDYIDSGCDKWDWFNQGKTEQERKKAHEGQVEQTKRQIEGPNGLKEARQKYCPKQALPSNQNNNQNLPSV